MGSLGWKEYSWEISKTFAQECYTTWRGEILTSVFTAIFIYLINRASVDFVTALLASAYVMAAWALWHLARSPWLIQRRSVHFPLPNKWGILGSVVALLCASLWIWTAAWFYSIQPRVTIASRVPDPRDAQIVSLQEQINGLNLPESPNSLRHRTNQLADEIQKYLQKRDQEHPPRAYPDSRIPDPDEALKKAIKTSQDYDHETQEYFLEHYKDRMIGILNEYDAIGVNSGYLIFSVKQGYLNIAPEDAPIRDTCVDDLRKFRELAYHVDAAGHLIII